MNKSFKLSSEQFKTVFAGLSEHYCIVGPKRFAGLGRFSDTDLIRYAPLTSIDELELAEKSCFSPKDLVFPPDETLFYFNGQQFSEAALPDNLEIIVLLRPCDINGIDRLDRMFMKNADVIDPYYQRRRSRLHFFMIECRESFENCFCVSMNANRSDNYAAALRFGKDGVEAEVASDKFLETFAVNGSVFEFKPEFVSENQIKVELPKVETMPPEIFTDKLWEEYDSRCISCGRCNTSCVTCSCFTTRDLFYGDSRTCGERRRVWDGCHLDGFCDMAGGHTFRKNKGERMRFKTFHKIYDYRKRFGVDMCVGCGRCDDVCPEYISFSNCINKLSARLKEGAE
ncbi:MAG: anaerobic sulfite reductase subunit AsrA [Candidatus Riflebacteria bacterium]|nr:anaerobic sulfite reductase subunit AsrA [Candidatus Riflebacteria bacterium]